MSNGIVYGMTLNAASILIKKTVIVIQSCGNGNISELTLHSV